MNHLVIRPLAVVGLLLCLDSLEAEPLRGVVRGELLADGPSLTLGLDEVAIVPLPPGSKFSRALEIEVTVPRGAMAYRSSLAVFVYQKYLSTRSGNQGERIAVEVLPPAAKFYLQAPLVAKAGLKAAIDTAVIKLPLLDAAFPLALTLLPIDKDLPPGWQDYEFVLKARLVNANLGALVIQAPGLGDAERQQLQVKVGNQVLVGPGPHLLEPGPYTLRIALPGGDPVEVATVVPQAKTAEVVVDLVPEEPTLLIEAPEGAQIVIDGKRVPWKPSVPLPIERGTHQVQLVLGSTVISESFQIDRGGRHRLTLQMSLKFQSE